VRTDNILILLTLISISCSNQQGNGGGESKYFSLDSLVDSQVSQLSILTPSLRKEAILDESKENALLQLDRVGWENELKIFKEANIDKPAYYGAYTIMTGKQDQFSNLLYDEYLASDTEDVEVKSLKIYYLGTKSTIKKVEVKLIEKNELFESERELSMIFDDRENGPILSSYHVKGNQKLKLNKVVTYEISGNLIY